jgi:hypothetical protein
MRTTETALTAHVEHHDTAVDRSTVTAEAGPELRQGFGIGTARSRGSVSWGREKT